MNKTKITQKDYLNQLQTRNKGLVVLTLQNKNSIEECFKELETTLNKISDGALKEAYLDQTWIKLISGLKQRLVFENDNIKYYGSISGEYFKFNFKGFDFIINAESDESLKEKNFKLYTLSLSFLKGEV